MTVYAALLRGINLGSRNKVGMGDLRRLLGGMGLDDVSTYLQSGNAVFSTADARGTAGGPPQDPHDLAAAIEQRITAELNLNVTVLLRTAEELAEVVAGSPYLDRETDLTKLHVTFLGGPPDPERAAGLAVPAGEPAEFTVAGRDVYLHTPGGYGRSKLGNAWFERQLGVAATTRNWRTVTKLRDLTADLTPSG